MGSENQNIDRKTKFTHYIYKACMIFCFLVFSFILGRDCLENFTLHNSGLKTKGEITQIEMKKGRKGSSPYPIFKFETEDGKAIEQKSRNRSISKISFQVGDKIDVFYQPENPTAAKINTFSMMWLPSIVYLIVSLITGYIGIIPLFKMPIGRSTKVRPYINS